MPLTGFLKIDEIPGESQRVGHVNEIELHDMHWGLERTASTYVGRSRTKPRTETKPLTIYKYYDAASPSLAEAVHQGRRFGEVELALSTPLTEGNLDYLVITMENVVISSYDVASNREDMTDLLLEERVEIDFEKVTIKFTRVTPDGTPGNQHEVELHF